MKKHKYCDGCGVLFNEIDDEFCDFYKDNEDGDCPCTECIVKPMCYDSCEAFIEWTYNPIIVEGGVPI